MSAVAFEAGTSFVPISPSYRNYVRAYWNPDIQVEPLTRKEVAIGACFVLLNLVAIVTDIALQTLMTAGMINCTPLSSWFKRVITISFLQSATWITWLTAATVRFLWNEIVISKLSAAIILSKKESLAKLIVLSRRYFEKNLKGGEENWVYKEFLRFNDKTFYRCFLLLDRKIFVSENGNQPSLADIFQRYENLEPTERNYNAFCQELEALRAQPGA